jgi:hypothetical protein
MTAAVAVEGSDDRTEFRGWYLYAVLDDRAVDASEWSEALSRAEGLIGLSAEGLRAAIGPVPETFDALARALEEVRSVPAAAGTRAYAELLEPAARSHEEVVELLTRCGPLLPVRLGTVLRSQDDVRRLLERRAVDLHRELRDLGTRREWSVKVWLPSAEAERLARAAVGARPHLLDGDGPGRRYLAARRQGRFEAEATEKGCDVLGRAIRADLAEVAEGTARTGALERSSGPVEDRADPETAWIQVLDGTFLVDAEHEQEFFSTLEKALSRSPVLRADCSGPWPPYTFVQFGRGEDP